MSRKTRNDTAFWYCLYTDECTPVLDEDGNETGELILHYAEPVEMHANVSPKGGNAQWQGGYADREAFGILDDYDRVIVVHDTECPITESTVLFIDKEPEFAEADTHEVIEAEALYGDDKIAEKHYVVPVYDYIVRRVARSLNEVRIAVSKVSAW